VLYRRKRPDGSGPRSKSGPNVWVGTRAGPFFIGAPLRGSMQGFGLIVVGLLVWWFFATLH